VDLTSSDDPTRRLIRQVLGAVAEFEKNVLVLKLTPARLGRADTDEDARVAVARGCLEFW